MIEPTLNTVPGTELPGISFTKEELEKTLEEAFKDWQLSKESRGFPQIGYKRCEVKMNEL